MSRAAAEESGPRVRLARFPRLLWLLPMAALLIIPRSGTAASPQVSVAGGDSLDLWVLVQWDEPLPAFVEERLERGIPATVGLSAELMAKRTLWRDRRVSLAGREMQIARDAWAGGWLLIDGTAVAVHDSLAGLRAAIAHQRVHLPLDAAWCDGTTPYRLDVTAYVVPLTAEDAGEVESWLGGQIRGLGRGILGIPRALFGVVRDLSGLGERASRGGCGPFMLEASPTGRITVRTANEEVGTAGGIRAAKTPSKTAL